MIARRKPKKGSVAGRVQQMYNEAATKGEAKYTADREAAKAQVRRMEENKKKSQSAQGTGTSSFNRRAGIERDQLEKVARDKAAVRATPVQDVETRRSSGMYQGSVPVGGTGSKKLYRKSSPIKGIRKSDAKGSVKSAMIRKMKGTY